MKSSGGTLLHLLQQVDEDHDAPAYLRLYRQVRGAILSGGLPGGSRLPSSRTLARELSVSRNTVEAALGQLRAEGLLARRVGSGSFVAEAFPDAPRRPDRRWRPDPPAMARAAGGLSARGRLLMAAERPTDTVAGMIFGASAGAVSAIPLEPWRRMVARHARRSTPALMLPGAPAGLRALREAIAAHAATTRGVRCGWEQVVVVASTGHAIALAAQLLLDPGDRVWMEEPGYPAARAAFTAAGAIPVPVRVDAEGLDVSAGRLAAPDGRLAYVTPSHQYPLGHTLSLDRRVALLAWAREAGAWVLEDDYDSEFRYAGRPLAAMQGIDGEGRVLYVGTFNKVMFHALRTAYLILPPDLVEPFARARTLSDGFVPLLTQAALAEFLADGHFALLLRRLREIYRERRDCFVAAATAEWGAELRLGPLEAGLHATLEAPGTENDRAASDAALACGISVPALSRYYAASPGRRALLVHFANALPADIPFAVDALARVLRGTPPRG
jgi:GntR family transcriptional regulator / MocR family aminotransferase